MIGAAATKLTAYEFPQAHIKTDPVGEDWIDLCSTSKNGKPLNNLENVMIALENDPALKHAFSYDGMTRDILMVHPLPGTPMTMDPAAPRPLTEYDLILVQHYLQQCGLKQIGKKTVSDGIEARARDCSRHVVREYLDGLKWDGTKRLENWLVTYLGCSVTTYVTGVGAMFMIGMVARIYEPGCKVDYMLILEGPQGAGKSTVCKVMGGVFYSDALPSITGSKDPFQHLRGKWLIEVAELAAMSKSEGEHMKAFLTRTAERYRPPYAAKEVHEPRQCVFVGTTNQHAYLKDETGARRFWPVKIGTIDVVALAADRDQLFAEAVQLYHSSAAWFPSAKFEEEFIRPEQEARFEPDPWESPIRASLDTNKPDRVYIGDLLDVIGVSLASRGRAHQNRVSAILTRLGWERMKKDGKGKNPWCPPPSHGQHG